MTRVKLNNAKLYNQHFSKHSYDEEIKKDELDVKLMEKVKIVHFIWKYRRGETTPRRL